jgi:hypothetical protein
MSNIDLSKFVGCNKNILDDLYNEERANPQVLGYDDYLNLPKTDAYIAREKRLKEEKQIYEDRIESKYDHIINKISTNQ